MNLIDAIKSKKPFKRPCHKTWFGPFLGALAGRMLSREDEEILFTDGILIFDVIADDWELKQQIEDITISRKKYSDSWHRATIDLKIYDVSPSVLRTFRDFIARELGFENY